MKTIGIVGTRKKNSIIRHFRLVEEAFLELYEKGDTICSGLCPSGADRFAVILQKKYRTGYVWHPADWDKHGRGAGFIRNTYIARDSDYLIALVADDRKGGTEDTIKKFVDMKGSDNLIILK